ncbi:MAG: WecB/TagA/CpsF family glycosyltransferase [Nitriliruptorales bacterium]|nr:WecB/TagA/CpsF family glycosyltransferase [Nitriliruptorales bacterium]
MTAARERRSLGLTALATHGLMLAAEDGDLRRQVNSLDIVTPDGQPVRWALNALWDAKLVDRVYGPDLTGHVCAAAASEGVAVYLFGSTPETCHKMADHLRRRYPGLTFAGIQPDRFRDATPEEDAADVEAINTSGAGVVLVGRGCPRQERWVADHLGRVNAAMLAVGAAFDYYAGTIRRPPAWMQRVGMEWLHRLIQEPGRLWRRYVIYNTKFAVRFSAALVRRRLLGRPGARSLP